MSTGSSTRLDRLLDRLEHFGIKLGLERMRGVLRELGSPEARLPVVLVAGTNGKGSVSAWLAAIATAAGYRSGLYTSPHLERVEERLRVDGRSVPTRRLVALLERVLEASRRAGGEPVTYFEALTAAALCWFAEEAVDLAVLEVGLGGRLDATNVADPVLAVITPIALDHQRQLGDTLAEITTEKAGILRPDLPALAAPGEPEVERTLSALAAGMGSRLELLDSRSAVVARRELGRGQRVTLTTPRRTYRLEPRLPGRHQIDNLLLAVLAAERLAGLRWPAIDARAIESGIAGCRWPGRLEWVTLAADPGRRGGRQILLDCAHNGAGLRTVAAYLRGLRRPFSLVFGMLEEKVEPRAVAALWRAADLVVVTQPCSARALAPEELVAQVGHTPGPLVAAPRRACELALELDRLLVVCGSIYLVGEVRQWLRETYGVPESSERLF